MNKKSVDKKKKENTKRLKDPNYKTELQKVADESESKTKHEKLAVNDKVKGKKIDGVLDEVKETDEIEISALSEGVEEPDIGVDINKIDFSSLENALVDNETGLLLEEKEEEEDQKILDEVIIVKKPLIKQIKKYFASLSVKRGALAIFLAMTLIFSSISWILAVQTESQLNSAFNNLNAGLDELNSLNYDSASNFFDKAEKSFISTKVPSDLSKLFIFGNIPMVVVGIVDQQTLTSVFYIDAVINGGRSSASASSTLCEILISLKEETKNPYSFDDLATFNFEYSLLRLYQLASFLSNEFEVLSAPLQSLINLNERSFSGNHRKILENIKSVTFDLSHLITGFIGTFNISSMIIDTVQEGLTCYELINQEKYDLAYHWQKSMDESNYTISLLYEALDNLKNIEHFLYPIKASINCLNEASIIAKSIITSGSQEEKQKTTFQMKLSQALVELAIIGGFFTNV